MDIYLVGASNPETIRMIRAVESSQAGFNVVGFLDNNMEKKGKNFYGYKIFGGTDLVSEIVGSGNSHIAFVNLITGSLIARYEVSKEIVKQGGHLVNFIHPTVDLFMSKWGCGNYVQEGVIVQAGVNVGDNNSFHMGALLGHETTVGNSAFIAHGVSVSGCCVVGDGTFIGTNATVLPRLRIGAWATIGAGSVVIEDVPDYAVVVGNPAKIIRFNEAYYADARVY